MWWMLCALAHDKPEGRLPGHAIEGEAQVCREREALIAAIRPTFPAFSACVGSARIFPEGPSLTVRADGTAIASTGTRQASRDRCAREAVAALQLPPAPCEVTISWPWSSDPSPAAGAR